MTTQLSKRDIVIPLFLVLLSAVPMVGGVARLLSLSAPTSIENARFVAAPAPVVLHVAAATLYAVLGAFQFSAGVRRRWPRWHRVAGLLLAACAIVTALTGIWMATRYEIPAALQGPLLRVVRVAVAALMLVSILRAMQAIRRRDVPPHEAWMIRAYALAQGAGTQAIVLGPVTLLAGDVAGTTRDVAMTLTWLFNLAFAEWIIRRHARPPEPERRSAGVSLSRA